MFYKNSVKLALFLIGRSFGALKRTMRIRLIVHLTIVCMENVFIRF